MTTPVEQFAADYFVRERLSAGRQQFMLKALAEFHAFAGRPPEDLHDEDLRAFLAHLLHDRHCHVNYVRKYNHALKPFYKWAWQARIIGADQYMRIREVKNPRGASPVSTPRPYKRTEVQQFWCDLDAAWALADPKFIARWRRGTSPYRRVWRHAMHLQIEAVASLALFGGLRNAEIRELSVDDLHPDNEFIVVRGKTVVHGDPKVREVPYTERGRELVARWLEFRDWMQPSHGSPWLVISANASLNNAVAPSEPNWPMQREPFRAQFANIGPGYELHRFRHTCATEWLRAGMELERVSRLLGHANLSQTLCYAELVRDDIASSMRRHERTIVGVLGRAA